MTSRGTKYWNSGAIPLIAPDILGDIITEVADIGIVIDDDGTILSVLVNPAYDMFKRLEQLEGEDIRACFAVESREKLEERLRQFLNGEKNLRPLELNHKIKAARIEWPVRYSLHQIGPDGAILMLGRDLRPVAEMQQQLVQAQLSLERDYEAQREFETRFRVVMETTTNAIALVSLHSGKVIDANSLAATMFGMARERLIGQEFGAMLESRKRGDILDRLTTHAMSNGDSEFKAKILRGNLDVIIAPTAFRVAGERLLMCRVETASDVQGKIDPLSQNLGQLYTNGPDAIVFAHEDGTILSANDGFLEYLGAAHDNGIKGQNLTEFMLRGSVDLKVMTENATRSGKMRSYSTKIAGEYGSPRSMEIAVTALQAGKDAVYAFVMREATRGEVATKNPVDESVQSVMDLVGSATLKDIVSETTNVVERMCIETAIELTMNNRVAAAEMLGLSRQSLYVKLRKFGILNKDD